MFLLFLFLETIPIFIYSTTNRVDAFAVILPFSQVVKPQFVLTMAFQNFPFLIRFEGILYRITGYTLAWKYFKVYVSYLHLTPCTINNLQVFELLVIHEFENHLFFDEGLNDIEFLQPPTTIPILGLFYLPL